MIRPALFAEPCRRGWYVADAEMRDMRGVIFISKRAAVAFSKRAAVAFSKRAAVAFSKRAAVDKGRSKAG